MIEYKIRFEEGGVAITQRLSSERGGDRPNLAESLITGQRDAHQLGETFTVRPPATPTESDVKTSSSTLRKGAEGGSEPSSASTGSGGPLPLPGGIILVFGSLIIGEKVALGLAEPDRAVDKDTDSKDKDKAKGTTTTS